MKKFLKGVFKMIFDKDTFKDYPYLQNMPTCNVYDCTGVCSGDTVKELFTLADWSFVDTHFNNLQMSVYVIYVPKNVYINNLRIACFVASVDDIEENKCHVLGLESIDKTKPIPKYNEAKELYKKELNWIHIEF